MTEIEEVYESLLTEYPDDQHKSKINVICHILLMFGAFLFILCDLLILCVIIGYTYYYVTELIDIETLCWILFGGLCLLILLCEIMAYILFINGIGKILNGQKSGKINKKDMKYYQTIYFFISIVPFICTMLLTIIVSIKIMVYITP